MSYDFYQTLYQHRNCKRYISQFIENQFPGYYQQYGQAMIELMEAYYEFEEETNYQFLNVSSCMEEKNDIDTTLDEFVVFFKSKYMKDLPFDNTVDNRFLIKHIFDLYQSKGTPRSLQLLMQIMYGTEAEVYYPGDDVFRPSHSIWWQPRYLEVSSSPMTKQLIGKKVYGQISGATAIVDSVVTKRVNGRTFDVMYLQDTRGEFVFNEYITDGSSDIYNFPYTTGSMSSLEIVDGGANFAVGDLFDVKSQYGDGGIVSVGSVADADFKITWDFDPNNYGFAPTIDSAGNPIANSITQIYVSDSALAIANLGLLDGDMLTQYIEYIDVVGPLDANVAIGDLVTSPSANGYIHDIIGNTVIVELQPNSFSIEPTIEIDGIPYTVNTVTDSSVISTVMESSNSVVWSYGTTNGPYLQNSLFPSYVYDVSNNPYPLTRVYSGYGASFQIQNISNEETITYVTDIIQPYAATTLDSADYAFPATVVPAETINTRIVDALSTANTTIGSVEVLSRINTGFDYTADVKVKVVTDIIARDDRYDVFIDITGTTIGFAVGQTITQPETGARGRVIAVNENTITVLPMSYMNRFLPWRSYFVPLRPMIVEETNQSFAPEFVDYDPASNVMGNNLIVTGTARPTGGMVTSVNIVSSGFNFRDGDLVTMYPRNGGDPVTAIARTNAAGISAGAWLSTTSHLNWSTYIHDNDYYQEYSYEVSAPQSLDKYEDVVFGISHPSGTKLFGKVVKSEIFIENEVLVTASREIL